MEGQNAWKYLKEVLTTQEDQLPNKNVSSWRDENGLDILHYSIISRCTVAVNYILDHEIIETHFQPKVISLIHIKECSRLILHMYFNSKQEAFRERSHLHICDL